MTCDNSDLAVGYEQKSYEVFTLFIKKTAIMQYFRVLTALHIRQPIAKSRRIILCVNIAAQTQPSATRSALEE